MEEENAYNKLADPVYEWWYKASEARYYKRCRACWHHMIGIDGVAPNNGFYPIKTNYPHATWCHSNPDYELHKREREIASRSRH